MRLIDADAMLENEFEAYMSAQLKADYLTTQINEVVHRKMKKLILDTPTIEAEPVNHGRWLSWEENFPGKIPKKKNNLGVFCSSCRLHADNRSSFCPQCGARMDGGESNDD